MKKFCLFLSLILLLSSVAGCSKTEDAPENGGPSESAVSLTQTSPEGAEPAPQEPDGTGDARQTGTDGREEEDPSEEPAQIGFPQLPDLTVAAADGSIFSLGAALSVRDAVIINLWATWCGYCLVEFPYIESVYRQYSDRVSMIALSVEETDSAEKIGTFAAEHGLTFPMGSACGTYLENFADDGIPVTLVLDRSGRLIRLHLGAVSSAEAFLALFEDCLAPDYKTPDEATYTVYVYNYDTKEYVSDCTVAFCAGDRCVPVKTDAQGKAVFTGAPMEYTVEPVGLPEGVGILTDEVLFMGPWSCEDEFIVGDTGE